MQDGDVDGIRAKVALLRRIRFRNFRITELLHARSTRPGPDSSSGGFTPRENERNIQLLSQIRVLSDNQLNLHKQNAALKSRLLEMRKDHEDLHQESSSLVNIQRNLCFQLAEYRKKVEGHEDEGDQLLMEIQRRTDELKKSDLVLKNYKEKLETLLQRNVDLANLNLSLERKLMHLRKGDNPSDDFDDYDQKLIYRTYVPVPHRSFASLQPTKVGASASAESSSGSSGSSHGSPSGGGGGGSSSSDAVVPLAHDGRVCALRLVERVGLLVSAGCSDEAIRFWGMDGTYVNEIKNFRSGKVFSIACLDEMIASVGDSREVGLFVVDYRSDHQLLRRKRVMKGHSDVVRCVEFTKQHILSGSRDRTVKLWDIKTSSLYRTYLCASSVHDVCVIDSNVFCTACFDGTIKIYDVRKANLVAEFSAGHTLGPLVAADYEARSNYLLTLARDNKCNLFDLNNFRLIRSFEHSTFRPSGINSISFHPSGSVFSAGSRSGHVFVWNILKEAPIQILRSQHGQGVGVSTVLCGKDGLFASSGMNGRVNLYSSRMMDITSL